MEQRERFLSITDSIVFPLRFCATHWVQNESVAEHAVLVWPNIVQIDKFSEKNGLSKQSYTQLTKQAVSSLLMIPKLHFFGFIASFLWIFPALYQTDTPKVF